MSAALESRVETLEALMADTLRVVRETSLEVDRLSREMREFKAEMRGFKTEMRDFKTEMREFKAEMRESQRDMNRKWGDLAASLGTVVEDIVAPSMPRVLREVFGCPAAAIEFSGVRVKRKHPSRPDYNREFDALAAGLYVDPSVAAYAEKRGLIVLGTSDDLMTVLNAPGFTPRAF